MKYITLNNGLKMPQLGYGVYQVSPEECEQCVLNAIKVGYRSIDTAQAYNNETGVGNAIVKCNVPRSELFITTKIWISNTGYEKAKASINESLKKLQTNYIDLLLIHQPIGDYYGAYKAMEEAYKEGKVKAIGVSNFYPDRLVDICLHTNILPMVNQIETHVLFQQHDARVHMHKYKVAHESWGPFAEGRNNFFSNPTLIAIGKKHNKSVAQVALRYLLQLDVILIPKSSHIDRMKENFEIFDFSLTADEMQTIRNLDQKKTAFFEHTDPAMIELMSGVKK